MLNQIVLVGRLYKVEKIKDDNITKVSLTLKCQRNYKNEDGEYETDYIKCIAWNGVAENVLEYCTNGNVIGIRGRIQTIDDKTEVIAEKITFLKENNKENNPTTKEYEE